jgi:hypothetical protein
MATWATKEMPMTTPIRPNEYNGTKACGIVKIKKKFLNENIVSQNVHLNQHAPNDIFE